MLAERNTLSLRTALVLGLVTVLAIAVTVRADDTTLLKKAELKNLIANAKTAADHRRIAQHFDAEAAKWEAEANTHEELEQYYRRNPDPTAWRYSRSPRSFEHCDSLVKDLRKAAQESRQLAADHRGIAKEAK
jgi:hypothetical protein